MSLAALFNDVKSMMDAPLQTEEDRPVTAERVDTAHIETGSGATAEVIKIESGPRLESELTNLLQEHDDSEKDFHSPAPWDETALDVPSARYHITYKDGEVTAEAIDIRIEPVPLVTGGAADAISHTTSAPSRADTDFDTHFYSLNLGFPHIPEASPEFGITGFYDAEIDISGVQLRTVGPDAVNEIICDNRAEKMLPDYVRRIEDGLVRTQEELRNLQDLGDYLDETEVGAVININHNRVDVQHPISPVDNLDTLPPFSSVRAQLDRVYGAAETDLEDLEFYG